MREIKFRAWDEAHKRMIYNVAIIEGFPCVLYIEDGDNQITYQEISENAMQYTGLKDKNGTEIYEGDIVKQYDDICVIERRVGGFCLDMIKGGHKGSEFSFDCLHDRSCVVIGNIYKNSELLEVQP